LPCFENERAVLAKMLGQGMLDINVRDLGGCHITDDDFLLMSAFASQAKLPNFAISLAFASPPNQPHTIDVVRLGRLGFEYLSKFSRSIRKK
jgi:hypothetical protein